MTPTIAPEQPAAAPISAPESTPAVATPFAPNASANVQDFFSNFVDNPSDEVPPQQPETLQTADPGNQPQQTQQPPAIDYEGLAGQYGLDASNPQHRTVIEKLAGPAPAPVAPVPESTSPVFDMSSYEEALFADLQPTVVPVAPVIPVPGAAPVLAPPAIDPAAQPVQPQGNLSFNDGFTWKDEVEAYEAIGQAWDNRDTETHLRASQALFNRNLQGAIPYALQPHIQPLMEKLKALEAIVEEVYQPVKQSRADERYAYNSEVTKKALSFVKDGVPRPGFEDFPLMFVPPSDNSTVVINGQQVPASPINKIVAEFPGILDMTVYDPDPDKSQRKKLTKQYEHAYKIFKATQVKPLNPQVAQQIFNNGRAVTQQREQETARHGLNAPGQPNPAAGNSESWVSQINRETGSAADFFRTS